MMELADVTDSKSVGATRAGSSPATGTKAKTAGFAKSLPFFYFYNTQQKGPRQLICCGVPFAISYYVSGELLSEQIKTDRLRIKLPSS